MNSPSVISVIAIYVLCTLLVSFSVYFILYKQFIKRIAFARMCVLIRLENYYFDMLLKAAVEKKGLTMRLNIPMPEATLLKYEIEIAQKASSFFCAQWNDYRNKKYVDAELLEFLQRSCENYITMKMDKQLKLAEVQRSFVSDNIDTGTIN